MNAADYRKLIKKDPRGGYLFYGEEEYMKRFCVGETRKAVSDDNSDSAFSEFSVQRFTAEKTEDFISALSSVYEFITSPAMFTQYKLAEITSLDIKQMKDAELDALCDMLTALKNDGYNDGILIINTSPELYDAGTAKRPSKTHTRLSEFVTAVEFPTETLAKLSAWVKKHFESEKLSIDDKSCALLIERCKYSMTLLSNEISKLCSYSVAAGNESIDEKAVKNVSCAYDNYDEFALSDAVMKRDKAEAYNILASILNNKNAFAAADKPEVLLAQISRVFCDMYQIRLLSDAGRTSFDISKMTGIHEYRVGLYQRAMKKYEAEALDKILDICAETDIKIKSSGLDNYMLIDRLIAEL